MAGFQKIYTSQNQYLEDVARSTGLFDDEYYGIAKETGKDAEYLALIANMKDNVSSSFDRAFYDKLSGEERFNYLATEQYMDKSSDEYKKSQEYFNQRAKQIKNEEIYSGLNGFEKTMNSIGGWLGNAFLQVGGIVEGLIDAAIFSGSFLAQSTGIPALIGKADELAAGTKELIGKDTIGYNAAQSAMNDYINAYTFIDKNVVTQAINDITTGIVRMTPMLIPGVGQAGAILYYGSMMGNTAEQAITANPDINYGNLLLYTAGSVGLEALTEWASGKLFGDDLISSLMKGQKYAPTGTIVKTIAKNFGTEALEEAVAELFGSMMYAGLVTGNPEDIASIEDIFYAAIIGGLTGAIMSGGQIVTTKRSVVTQDGQLKYRSELTDAELKTAKKLKLSESWGLQSLIQQSQQALSTPDNVTQLMAETGKSISQLQTENATEYEKAVAKDAETKTQQAKAILDLANLMSTIGVEQFTNSAELLKNNANLATEYVNNFLNHTDVANKKASEVFSANYPGKSFTPTAIPSKPNQALAEALRQAFPQLKVVFGTFGSEDGLPVRAINKGETYLFLDENMVSQKGYQQVLHETIRYQLADQLMQEINILDNAEANGIVKLVTDLDVDYDKLTKEQKLSIAQILCFDPVNSRRLFKGANKTHAKIFNYITDQSEYVKKFGRQTEANKMRYHDLLEIRNMYIKNIAETISNNEDVQTAKKQYNLTDEETKTKIVDKTENTILNDTIAVMRQNLDKNVIARQEAIEELLQNRVETNKSISFDWSNLYNEAYYNENWVAQIKQQQQTQDFQEAIRAHLIASYKVDFSVIEHSALVYVIQNNVSIDELNKLAETLFTKEYLETNPELQSSVANALYTMVQTEDTDADSIIAKDNQIQGTGKLKLLSGLPISVGPRKNTNIFNDYDVARQPMTDDNRDAVLKARTNVILFAHNPDAASLLGITQEEFNKQLFDWAEYPIEASEFSNEINKNVPLEHRWVGLENLSAISSSDVGKYDLDSLVKNIEGTPTDHEKAYIMTTMLAIDTNIDYRNLSFEFGKELKADNMKEVYGLYEPDTDTIYVNKKYRQYTVAHEIGHAIDWLWGKQLTGLTVGLSDVTPDDIKSLGNNVKDWVAEFNAFVTTLESKADVSTEYYSKRHEIFARFIENFCNWVENKANVLNRLYFTDDYFSEADYVTFVKLLQEKSALDEYLDTSNINKLYELSDTELRAKIKDIQQQLITSTYTKTDTSTLETELRTLRHELNLRQPVYQQTISQKQPKVSTQILKRFEDGSKNLSEVQYSESNSKEYLQVSYDMIDEMADTFALVNDDNYDEVRKALKNSKKPYAAQALRIFDLYTIEMVGKFNPDIAQKIENNYQKTASGAGQTLALQAQRVAERKPISDTISTLKNDGFNVTVTDEIVQLYDSKLKDKEAYIKELEHQIKDLEKQLQTAKKDIDKAALNKQLKEVSDKKGVIQSGSNSDILDHILTHIDSPEQMTKLQEDMLGKLLNTAIKAQEEGKKVGYYIYDENGQPKPFPKATEKLTKTLKKLKSFRMWSMLSSPVTWVRNWLGNQGMKGLDAMTNFVEGFMTSRSDFDKSQMKFTESRAGNELYNYIAEQNEKYITALVRGEDVKYETSAEKAADIKRRERKIEYESANAFRKACLKAQDMADWGLSTGPLGDEPVVFRSICKNMGNLVANNINFLMQGIQAESNILSKRTTLTEKEQARLDILNKAITTKDAKDVFNALSKEETSRLFDICKERSFQQYFKNPNALSKWFAKFGTKHPVYAELVSWVMPFPKVAANVLSMAYRYSPLSFFKGLSEISKYKQMQDPNYKGPSTGFEKAQIIRTFSEASVGTFMLIAGAIFSAMGLIDIDDDDYMGPCINIGDFKVSLSDLAPSMTTFSTASAVVWAWKNDRVGVTDALNVLYDNTLLGNVENLLTYGSFTDIAKNVSISYISQYIPAVLKLINKGVTGGVKKDKSGNYLQRLVKTLGSYVPGLSQLVPNKIDPYTGKKVYQVGSENWFLNLLASLSPLGISWDGRSELEKQAELLGVESSGLSGRFSINDTDYTIKDKEKYAKYRAEFINNQYNTIISGKQKVTVEDENGKRVTTTYDKLTNEQKKNVINRLYTEATSMTKIKWWTDQGNKYVVTNRDLYDEYRKMFKNIIYKKNWSKSKFVES